ncbi:MAG: amidohydrolase [bacterium]|nr:amidohydrolase [bacterium]
MNGFRRFLIGLPFLLVACSLESERGREEIAYVNARVYTLDAERPWAEALAVRDGTIFAVGSEAQVRAVISERAEVIDLDQRMVIPGLHDVHVHALEAGLNRATCEFPPVAELQDLEGIARECANEQAGQTWVIGSGVHLTALREKLKPGWNPLERAVRYRPMLVLDDLGHGAWMNSQGLELAGFRANFTDPPGGILDRDPRTGALTGVVFENAQQAARDAARKPNTENRAASYRGLLGSLRELNANGITSVSDAGGFWTRGYHEAWRRAALEGRLTVRASNSLYLYPDRPLDAQVAELREIAESQVLNSNPAGGQLRFDQVKIYVDGILSQGTSALNSRYRRRIGPASVSPRGFLYFEPDALKTYARELSKAGFQLHFHATGDRGVALALDALEAAGKAGSRHRISHLYLVDPADWKRFVELEVIADFQLSPGSFDPEYRAQLSRILGRRRAAQLLPLGAALDAGVHTVLSSDWDAGPLSPFGTIERALPFFETREQGIARSLRMLTLDSAYVLHQEQQTGSIEVGKWADLAILDRDLFTTQDLDGTQVVLTLFQGEVVHRAEDCLFSAPSPESGEVRFVCPGP